MSHRKIDIIIIFNAMQYNELIRLSWNLISFIKYSKLKSGTYDLFLKLLLLL